MNGVLGSVGALFLCLGVGVVVFLAFNFLRIVPEYQRLVVFRLGRVLDKPKGPGVVLLIPGADRPVKVDLREQVREVPHQTSITTPRSPLTSYGITRYSTQPSRSCR